MNNLFHKVLHHPILHKQTVVQATILISLINFLSKFVGYAREMLIAKYFGATGLMDAYVIGLQVPTLVLGLFAGGLGTLIIPMYISRKQVDPQDAKRYVNQILVVWGTIFLAISALTAVFAPQMVKLVAYGFQGERFKLAVQITRLLALYGFFSIIQGYFTGLLHAEKQFFSLTLSTAVFNAVMVLVIYVFSKQFGVFSLVIGIYALVCGNLAISTVLLIKKYHLLSMMKISIIWIEIKEFFLLLLPLLLSSGVGTINAIVDRSIASTLPHGSIAALQYSQKIWQLPTSLFVGSIAITIFPTFSEFASNKLKLLQYKQSINKTIISLMYFLIPSSVFLIIFSLPITRLFYERGAFDTSASSLTSFVSQMYCVGILFMALYPILMRVFYSFKNTVTPLLISVLAVGLNVFSNIVLSKYLFAGGIALATSLTQIFAFMVAYMMLANYFKSKEIVVTKSGSNLFLEFVLLIVATIPMVGISFLLFPWASISSSFIVQATKLSLIALILGTIFYLASAVLKTKGHEIFLGYFIRGIKLLRTKSKTKGEI
jgi:putative peptidoglycan lipid II flippase